MRLPFQGTQKLVQDGIVGPKTHAQLENAYKALAKLIDDYVIPPADEAAARQRVVGIANSQLAAFGWLPNVQPPDPASPRIAIRYMTDAVTRARQGGFQLSVIYALAQKPAAKCLTIPFNLAANDLNPISEDQYKAVRNTQDLEHWRGIFALSVWNAAGLKNLPAWDSSPFLPWNGFVKQIGPKEVKEGDVGIIEPLGGRNHHFVVTRVEGNLFHSVDGNAGSYHSILGRKYRINDPNAAGPGPHVVEAIPGVHGSEKAYFVTPVWSKIK